ncbi:unnamed protein product [Lupinus luteus]|uniref:Uncharacterized protein n=1 Tax=Lupinus luteus TaxID=3873 RepID=A0AAV1XIK5_LUPLU
MEISEKITCELLRLFQGGIDAFNYNGDLEISMNFPGDGPNPLVVSQTASIALCVSPRSVVPNDSPRVVPLSYDNMYVHPVLMQTGPRRIFTRVVRKGICWGLDPVTVDADCLIVEFKARRESRSWKSDRMIEDFSD